MTNEIQTLSPAERGRLLWPRYIQNDFRRVRQERLSSAPVKTPNRTSSLKGEPKKMIENLMPSEPVSAQPELTPLDVIRHELEHASEIEKRQELENSIVIGKHLPDDSEVARLNTRRVALEAEIKELEQDFEIRQQEARLATELFERTRLVLGNSTNELMSVRRRLAVSTRQRTLNHQA